MLSLDIFIGFENYQKLTAQRGSVNYHLTMAMEEKESLSELSTALMLLSIYAVWL
jgi:hypothetical protein